MHCRVDSDVYAIAFVGVGFLSLIGYVIVNHANDNYYKNKLDMAFTALNYALEETQQLRDKLSHIRGLCDNDIDYTSVPGNVDNTDDSVSLEGSDE